eukprot:XP_028353874.1 uncharacterized protein LOC114487559 [Physeter catodon]
MSLQLAEALCLLSPQTRVARAEPVPTLGRREVSPLVRRGTAGEVPRERGRRKETEEGDRSAGGWRGSCWASRRHRPTGPGAATVCAHLPRAQALQGFKGVIARDAQNRRLRPRSLHLPEEQPEAHDGGLFARDDPEAGRPGGGAAGESPSGRRALDLRTRAGARCAPVTQNSTASEETMGSAGGGSPRAAPAPSEVPGQTHSLLETGAASLPEVKSQSGLQVREGWPARDHQQLGMGARAQACSEVWSTEEWDRRSRVLKRAAVTAAPQPEKRLCCSRGRIF